MEGLTESVDGEESSNKKGKRDQKKRVGYQAVDTKESNNDGIVGREVATVRDRQASISIPVYYVRGCRVPS